MMLKRAFQFIIHSHLPFDAI